MKIKKIITQHRRDFRADYECEFCGHVDEDSTGYDDANFHQNVIPSFQCPECKKSTNSEGGEIDNTQTRYPEGFQI